jgi:esterase
MAEDLIRLADKIGIEKFTILGHSMGGKIAMTVATKYPERIDGVITVDTAPYDYNPSENLTSVITNVANKLQTYNIIGVHKNELLDKMTKDFNSVAIAYLILSNIKFNKERNAIDWISNMSILLENTKNIYDFIKVGTYDGPFRAILAGNSKLGVYDFNGSFPHVTEDDLKYIDGAGHWVQSDKPHETIAEIKNFLDHIDSF